MSKLTIAALSLCGCFGYESYPAGRAAPHIRKIEEAKLLDLKVNLGEQPGLCPGQQGQLFADATVQWPGGHPVQRTIGKDVDSLAPASFSVTGALVRGDAEAHLIPDADIMKSVEAGFIVDITYTPQPSYRFHETFKPEYSCFTTFTVSGDQGPGGSGGSHGDSQYTKGANGKPGGNGHNGGQGQPGGKVEAFVTEVSTPFYPKLLAVRANDKFFLAPADKPLTFAALGGKGGEGGRGGSGSRGGEQDTYNETITTSDGGHESVSHGKGSPGNGGAGGNGGDGGDGGNGGTVKVTYDAAFPELAELVKTDVAGGAAGAAGRAGSGGEGGAGRGSKDSKDGTSGGEGSEGREGREGQPGHAQVGAGSVASKFRDLAGITVLGAGASAASPSEPHHHGGKHK
jgi:hypothetical protein